MSTKTLYVTHPQLRNFEERITDSFTEALNEGMSVIGKNFTDQDKRINVIAQDVVELKQGMMELNAKFDVVVELLRKMIH